MIERKILGKRQGPEYTNEFRAGVYKHYKGGLYNALFLAHTHENKGLMLVVYMSMTTGDFYTRPYNQASQDSWTDVLDIMTTDDEAGSLTRMWVPRFRYVGPQTIATD